VVLKIPQEWDSGTLPLPWKLHCSEQRQEGLIWQGEDLGCQIPGGSRHQFAALTQAISQYTYPLLS